MSTNFQEAAPSLSKVISLLAGNWFNITCRYKFLVIFLIFIYIFYSIIATKSIYEFREAVPSDSEVMSLLVGNSLYITCRYEYFFILLYYYTVAMKSIYEFPKAAFNLFEVMLVFVGIGCILGLPKFVQSSSSCSGGVFSEPRTEPSVHFR